ncbi:MAG: hypothetical protein A3F72_02935 [Bacteroidetes bacterium RIFCSPLOWO2_12_FULL_35_15]|nr:MAG: hypothetical protein A3F72_02935 [Bacteroidetes bacterium RIFCSPLOWO2_12_FULL_35_15]
MLLKSIADIKKVVPIIGSSSFTSFTPYIKQAERDFLIPNMSKTEYDALSAAYNVTTPTLSAKQTELLEKCQEVIVHYMLFLWIPTGQVSMGDNGIRINTTETLKTAFQWQIDDLSRSVLRSSGSAMDALLDYLEENKATFALWAASSAYTVFKECFITTTKQFSDLFSPIGNSRLNFIALRSAMKKAQEFDITAIIGESFYNELMTQHIANNLSANNLKVVALIQKALVPFTMKRAFTELSVSIDERGILNFNNTGNAQVVSQKQPAKDAMIFKLEMAAENDAKTYSKKLKEFLATNIADYATYAASDVYDSDTTDHSFTNDSESGNFFMG